MTDDTPRDYRDDIELDDELDLIRIAGREDARERFVACRYDLSVCHEEMRDSDATPALRSAGQPTRYAMPDETDEPDDEAMREMRERLRRGVVLRQLTEDERNARAQARAEAKVIKWHRR
jgi:hypothetical protein